MKQIEKIGNTFRTRLAYDDYDRQNGVCVKQYIGESDVVCMTKKPEEQNKGVGRKKAESSRLSA